MTTNSTFDNLHNHLKKIFHVEKIAGLTHWDQEVLMPPKSAQNRAELLAFLSAQHHQLWTSGEVETWLDTLKADDSLSEEKSRNVQVLDRDLKKVKKLPEDFVYRMSEATSEAYQAWLKASEQEDFQIFAPHLQKIVDLNLEKAEYYGYTDHPYDALLDDFEPGLKLKEVEKVLNDAKTGLTDLLDRIKTCEQPQNKFLYQQFDQERQQALSQKLAADLGFDFDAGRLDVSEHPFTMSVNPNDVRITTRFKTNDLAESIWSTVHETGHALYEQGLLSANYGLPSGEAISLGIHESQSRLWENHVGKSYAFVEGYLPVLKQFFPDQLGNISEKAFYQALNQVSPSLIRTSADEITYHLHILIRFELEKALMDKELKAEDLPEAWEAKYQEYLGVSANTLKEGVLQDVHWSHGAFGYFPTYSIGSFYAAQFFKHAEKAIPDLQGQLSRREFQPLLSWLRENIHQYGRLYNAREICEAISGEPLNFDYFKNYAWEKYRCIYELD